MVQAEPKNRTVGHGYRTMRVYYVKSVMTPDVPVLALDPQVEPPCDQVTQSTMLYAPHPKIHVLCRIMRL